MKIAGICFLILGGVLLSLSGLYLGAYFIFEKLPQKTGKTLGKLWDRKYKKDVDVWAGLGRLDGPPGVVFTIKHLTKTKYLYVANNKQYLCVFDFWRKPHKVPNDAWVIYLKAFPRISYLKHDENHIGAFDFVGKAIACFSIAISTLGLGFALL